jgi:invasion protein IalB
MFLRASLATAALLTTAALPATAQTEVRNGDTFGAWRVNCEALGKNRTVCILTQTLTRDTDGAFIAQMLAFWSADGSTAYLGARVPMGAYLPAGFIVQGENAEEGVPFIWQSCAGDICEALREVEGDMLQTLADENDTVLGQFRPNLNMEPLVFRFSMTGVIEGLEALHPDTD